MELPVFLTTVTAIKADGTITGVDILEAHDTLTGALESIRKEMVAVKEVSNMVEEGRRTLVNPRGDKFAYAVERRVINTK